jgi:hypothetical protein
MADHSVAYARTVRDRVGAGRRSGVKRHKKGSQATTKVRKQIEAIKAKHPTWTTSDAIHEHLKKADPDWSALDKDLQRQKVTAVRRRLQRADKKTR